MRTNEHKTGIRIFRPYRRRRRQKCVEAFVSKLLPEKQHHFLSDEELSLELCRVKPVRQQRSDADKAYAAFQNAQTLHLLLFGRSEDKNTIGPSQQAKEVSHHEATERGLHSWTEIGSDEETSPTFPRERVGSPGKVLATAPNVVHDIHAPRHLFEAAREIGADWPITEFRQQEATRQKGH